MDVTRVILSRGRSVLQTTSRIVRSAVLVVPESEVEQYKNYERRIVPIPDAVVGIGRVRNWILDWCPTEALVMLDDDISRVVSLTGVGQRRIGPDEIEGVIEQTAQCAQGAGCHLFGWNPAWDVRKYLANQPFELTGMIEGAIGMIKPGCQRFDDRIEVRGVDVDISLAHLLADRIVWLDTRFSFMHNRNTLPGGLSNYRTQARWRRDTEYLKAKWGRHVAEAWTRTTHRLSMHVSRRQSLDLGRSVL